MATQNPEDSNAWGKASDKGKGNREDREDLGWDARCEKPTQEITSNGRAVCAQRCKHGSGRGGRICIVHDTTWGAKCTGKSRKKR